MPEFVAQGEYLGVNALGYINICSNDIEYDEDTANLACGGDPVYKNDSVSIHYVGPQAVISRDSDTAQWELETVKAIKDWVSNKDNYIAL